MFDIGAFIIIGIGLFMLMNPDGYYELMESWKNNSSDQPSDFYRKCIRVMGGIGIGLGTAYFIVFFLL